MCAKPVSRKLWRYAEVVPHWDSLIARSWCIDCEIDVNAGERELYQEGTLARLLHPETLIQRGFGAAAMPPGAAMFCGTQAVLGELRPARASELELHDPALGPALHHRQPDRTLDP